MGAGASPEAPFAQKADTELAAMRLCASRYDAFRHCCSQTFSRHLVKLVAAVVICLYAWLSGRAEHQPDAATAVAQVREPGQPLQARSRFAMHLQLKDFSSKHRIPAADIVQSCGNGDRDRTLFLLRGGKLFYSRKLPPTAVRFPERLKLLLDLLRGIAESSDEPLPDMLFNWWSLDNAEASGCKRPLHGSFGYSFCPAPDCATSVVVPNEISGRADFGKLRRTKRGPPFYLKPARGEWHGSRSGHVPMRMLGTPSVLEPMSAIGSSALNHSLRRETSRTLFLRYCAEDARLNCSFGGKVSLAELAARNRAQCAIAGGSYASNFIDVVFTGSIVAVKQDYPAWAWYEPLFQPGVHYVLARRDLANFPAAVNDVLSSVNMKRFGEMVLRARRRALAATRPGFVRRHFLRILRSYAAAMEPGALTNNETAYKLLVDLHDDDPPTWQSGVCLGFRWKSVCCPNRCGQCGGHRCGQQSGGARDCCTSSIIRHGPKCKDGINTGCLVPKVYRNSQSFLGSEDKRNLPVMGKSAVQQTRYLLVDFKTHGFRAACGFNNQRQGLVAAAALSAILNRTLVVPDKTMANKHDIRPLRTRRVWDIRKLRSVLPGVELESSVRASLAKMHASSLRANPFCCDNSPEDIRTFLAARNEAALLHFEGTWLISRPYFTAAMWPVIGRISRAFSDELLRCGQDVVSDLTEISGSAVLHAVHMRTGDMRPCPLLDCEACGYHTPSSFSFHDSRPNARCTCRQKNGQAVTMSDALTCAARQGRAKAGDAIYVATNNASDAAVVDFMSSARSLGLRAFTWSSSQRSLQTPACQAARSAISVSIVEQMICAAVTGNYFAHFISSWDELVLHMRASHPGLHHEPRNQLELFVAMARKAIEGERQSFGRRFFHRTPDDIESTCKPCVSARKV